ncbi:MAG: NAD(P)H-hydrate dehydratase [Verrucomicrobiota bacterium]
MIATCAEMKQIEERAFARGITAESLMDEAGARIAGAVRQFFPEPGRCLVVFGKGHNGGDALVAARHLLECGWEIEMEAAFPREQLAELTLTKLRALEANLDLRSDHARNALPFADAAKSPERLLSGPTVILDGLLGIGGSPGLRDPIRAATMKINQLRREIGAAVFAIDIPTGLDGDTGTADSETVVADFTLTIGVPKRGLLADSALDYVGRLAVLPLPELLASESGASLESVATPASLSGLLPARAFSTHKGDCGRVGIVAGSRGLTGAAIMAANAAVRAGAGLVTLFVTTDIYPLIVPAVMPEVMVAPLGNYHEVLEHTLDVLAIGPGLGRENAEAILALTEHFPGPMVVDADALNALAGHLNVLHRVVGPRLLTPHPGEMRRLFADFDLYSRKDAAERFLLDLAEHGALPALLLKGARTLVAQMAIQPALGKVACHYSYNSTGNPGMASGGMGDVLTGTCAALAGQGLPLFDAARLAAWLCGRAAEIEASNNARSQESLSATDLLEAFGRAFAEVR